MSNSRILSKVPSDLANNSGKLLTISGGEIVWEQNYAWVSSNTAIELAQAAFDSANNVAPQIQPSFDAANAAFDQANTNANTISTLNDSFVSKTSSNGAAELPIGTTAERPSSANGLIRYNTDTGTFEGYSSSGWGLIGGGGAVISNTAPTSASEGDLWWDSDSGDLLVYYTDGDSSQWVPALSSSPPLTYAIVANTQPSLNIGGLLWWNQDTSEFKIYESNTSSWVDIVSLQAFNQANAAFDQANSAFDAANNKFSSSGGTISGNVDIAGSLTVEADLIVSGNVTTISANNISLQDNMIYLNDGAANNANPDLGFVGAYNDGTYHHTGIFRDATDGVWKVFDNYEPEPDASVWIDTSNNTFRIADFEANNITAGGISLSSDFRLPVGNTAQRPEASAGKLYYNSETGKFEGYGSAWGSIGGGALISDSAPSNPSSGDLWWNSSDGKTYIYYDSTWVQAQPGGEGQYLPLTGGTITGNVTVTEVLTANTLSGNISTNNLVGIISSNNLSANISAITATQTEMQNGSETALRSMSPINIKQAIDYQADRKGMAVAMSIVFGG